MARTPKFGEHGSYDTLTTHVMDEAEKCDSLAMMREGKILATGTAGELISLAKTDTIEEAFIYFSEEGGEKNEN